MLALRPNRGGGFVARPIRRMTTVQFVGTR
jgi:hypothetical protein